MRTILCQSYFSSDYKYLDSEEKWNTLVLSINKVLELFSTNEFSASELEAFEVRRVERLARMKMETLRDSQDDCTESSYFGCKFLTSSKVVKIVFF